MLQYIINSSAIWLIGLIVFDLFLRNEAQHGYNRLYLLAILFAGAFIPLWSWDYDSVLYTTDTLMPVVQTTATVQQTITDVADNNVIKTSTNWPVLIYCIGVMFMLLYSIKETVALINMYRKGKKSKHGTWTIIETGKSISPFSAFRYVYISNKESYDPKELDMILMHEEQHGHLLHMIDLLLTRIGCIIFWFNPLVYIIEKRLLMVHEYQADKAVRSDTTAYGQFLIEQSVLGAAPILAHSFIRSPLKKRILMLTRTTTILAKSKQLVILPVLLISGLCFAQNTITDSKIKKDGNKYTFRGNIVEYNRVSPATDTVMVQDPSTGEMRMVIGRKAPSPVKINGEPIYNNYSIRTPGKFGGDVSTQSSFSGQGLKMYLLTNMQKEIKRLRNGKYQLGVQDVVIDKKGKIVFYRLEELASVLDKPVNNSRVRPLDKETLDKFAKKISTLIDKMPTNTPADIEGTPVYSTKNGFWTRFTVKDKKLVSLE